MSKKLNLIFKKIKKPKNIWLGFIFSIFGGLAMIVPKIASAQFGIGLFGTAMEAGLSYLINKGAAVVSYALAWLGAQIIILEGKLLDWLVDSSQFTKLYVVQTGWGIARDIANLFFIGILIYIAFGIILKLEKFNASKLLFKLVLFAILINFSLTISGIIIDFSQALFKFFIFAPIKGEFELSPQLANALSIQGFWGTEDISAKIQSFNFSLSAEILKAIGRLIMTVVFTFITVIVFGAMIIILFVRNIYLWVLLILAPIAWICGLVPVGPIAANAKKWWDQFIKWATVAPVMGFFIFLTLLTAQGRSQLTGGFQTTSPGGTPEDLFRDNFSFVNIFQFVAVIGIMIAGLVAAEGFGSKTAKAAHGLIDRSGKAAKAWMQRQGAKGVGTVGGGALAGISKGVSKIPLLGALSKPIGVAGRSLQAQREKIKAAEIKKADERLSHLKSPDELSRAFPTLTTNEQIAAIKRAMKAGKMPDNMKDMALKLAIKGEINKAELLKIDPTLREEWQTLIKKTDKLEVEKNQLDKKSEDDPVFVAGGGKDKVMKAKQSEIDGAKQEFKVQVAKSFEKSSPTEISRTIASMDINKIPASLKDAIINNMAEDPVKYNSSVVMGVVGQKPIAEKSSFVEALLRARMNRARDLNPTLLTDMQQLDALKNSPEKDDQLLIDRLNKNPGLRNLKATFDNFYDAIKQKATEKEEKETAIKEKTEEIFTSAESAVTPESEKEEARAEAAAQAKQTQQEAEKRLKAKLDSLRKEGRSESQLTEEQKREMFKTYGGGS